MKTLILLLILPFFAQPQEKKDTKISVRVDTLNIQSRVKLALFENGYTVESEDRNFVASTEKSMGSRSIKIRVLIKADSIVITGQVANDVTISIGGVKVERTFERVYYGGMKGSDNRIAWEELVKFARIFGTGITYSK